MNSELNIDPQLLKILCCPKCKGKSELVPDNESRSLVCDTCKSSYNLKKVAGPDGQGMLIPELLIQDED